MMMEIQAKYLLSPTKVKSVQQRDSLSPIFLKSKSLGFAQRLCQTFLMLVRLWLSRCWNAVYLLTGCTLIFRLYSFYFPALCVLIRAVNVLQLILN